MWKISWILIVRYTTFMPSIAPQLTHCYIILLDIEFDDSTKLLLELLHWKSKGSTSNHDFQKLRNILAPRIKLPAMSTTVMQLQSITDIQCHKVHCCENQCIAFTENYADL